MHGLLLKALKDLVETRVEGTSYDDVRAIADTDASLFVPLTDYPDAQFDDLLGAASEATGRTPAAVQRALGRFLAPRLLDVYDGYLPENATAIDVLMAAEDAIESATDAGDMDGFRPPDVSTTRLEPETVLVAYRSDRGLCALAGGLIEGIAAVDDTPLDVEERTCTDAGADRCEFAVRTVAAVDQAAPERSGTDLPATGDRARGADTVSR